MTALIPLPFVDEWVERMLLKALYQDLARQAGVELTPAQLSALVDEDLRMSGLVLGIGWKILFYPIKKLFRSVVFFLTIKDIIDLTSRTSHRASMVQIALQRARLAGREAEIRQAMDEVLGRVSTSPVSRWLLWKERPASAHWEGTPGDAVYKLVRVIHEQGGGGLVLERFAARLDTLPPPPQLEGA